MPNKSMTAGIYTLGCKVNQYESQAIAEALESKGFSIAKVSRACDVYVINTCTVTAESDRKTRQFIRRAISANPKAYILVTGCMAQTAADKVAEIEGVDAVVGNTDKLCVADIAERLALGGKKAERAQIIVGDVDRAQFEKMNITKFERTRAYVKIEDGCESHCTYCIIPAARGKIRSKSPDDVLREVEELTRGGCREVVLTGIETASYGKDLGGIDLASLLCKVDKIEGIGRVRLGSLDPSLIKPDFVEKIADLRSLAPHFHLSLQSGSNAVLALMKRKYNAEMAARAMELLREKIPNVKFTTDIIVGFPGESEQNFLETVEFVKKAGFLTAHIFPYSKREGTPAATMDGQIPKTEKSRRLHVLSEVEALSRRAILEREIREGRIAEVLFESYRDGVAIGHTADFIEVHVPSPRPLHAELFKVKLLSTDSNICTGVLL